MIDLTAGMEELARQFQQGSDMETLHMEADDLLVAFPREQGYEAAMDAYESIDKWYA